MAEQITRRQALQSAGAAGLGLTALGGVEGLLAAAAGASPRHGSLRDIEHVVFLIQENRAFDHYFGTMSGVRGFDDRSHRADFTQRGTDGKKLHPFHLSVESMNDITHDWAPQHRARNGGRMDRFLSVHEQSDGAAGPETLGYYTRRDIPFYYRLADAFTICDGYHCSVIGPTDPNRLMSMAATLDPAGHSGGPLLHTKLGGRDGGFTWKTMPERLTEHGVSWKVYTAAGGGVLDNVLTYFDAYRKGSKLYDRGDRPDLPARLPHRPLDGTAPSGVMGAAEPGGDRAPRLLLPRAGEFGAAEVVQALASHPDVWRKTTLFLTWDENGGFLDHVPPPTPPSGTPGEYLTRGQAARRRRGDPRTDRPRLPGSDAGRLPLLPRRAGVLADFRSHLHAALPGDPLPRASAEPHPLAAAAHRRAHWGVQLRRPPQRRATPPAQGGRSRTQRSIPLPAPVREGPMPRQERGRRRRPSGSRRTVG